MGRKKLATVAFNSKDEIFVVYIATLAICNEIYSFCKAQLALLKLDETLITVFPEYFNFVDVFSLGLTGQLPE